MLLAKIKGVLINPKVVSMLLDIIKKLTQTPKYEALRRGWKRIREMLSTFRRNGVLNWAPRVREWMSDERFIIYLGFMEMNNPIYYRSTL